MTDLSDILSSGHWAVLPPDLDPVETREWLESIDSVLKTHGAERAQYLLERVIDFTRRSGAYLPFKPKKKTKASEARERGLEPLALRIWSRDETLTDLNAAAAELVAEHGRQRAWIGPEGRPRGLY